MLTINLINSECDIEKVYSLVTNSYLDSVLLNPI